MRNVLIATVAATVVVAAAGCGGSTKPAASSEPITTPPTSAAASTSSASAPTADASACTELGGTVDGANLCAVHSEKAGYTIDMSFPIDYPDQRAVANVLKRQRDQFVTTVEEPPVSPMPKALDIKSTTFRSGTPEAGTRSLVFEEYVNVGGAHPETYYDALNYDLSKKAPITFGTLFKPTGNPVGVLDPIVQNALKNQLSGAPVDDNTVGAKMYENFALTDDAVIFYIGQGRWTIEAAGAQQVSVPRTELASILA